MTTSHIKQTYIEAGQAHLFKFWDELSADQQNAFLDELARFDPKQYLQDVQDALHFSSSVSGTKAVEPLPNSTCYSSLLDSSAETIAHWTDKGLELIAQNKVGVILMAGGQGTRLGSDKPKGAYDVGLPSHKSLFQLQCERITRLKQLTAAKFGKKEAEVLLPLYVMTSGPTVEATEQFFVEHDYFGLPQQDVVFFNQGTLPALSLDGKKLLLGSKHGLFNSPDGNGGFYRALQDNRILEDFHRRGIEHVHAYCVDNILVKVADPVFIGYSVAGNYDIATKVVRKNVPSEKVGLIVLDKQLQTPCVIEYSEVSQDLIEKKDPANSALLLFRAANIVNHYYRVSFLDEMIPQWVSSRKHLPYHIAQKKIKCVSEADGSVLDPAAPNGVKMEQFIFDVFPSVQLERFGCLEVDRAEEFSPLKNAPGAASNCAETCRKDCLKRTTGWVVANGGQPQGEVEVSPLTSYDGEGLAFVNGRGFKGDEVI